jgi:hypothetical protein
MITQKLTSGLFGAFVLLAVCVLAFFAIAPKAHAQALTWTASEAVDLSSPDVNLTIVSGSEATSLVVGTGDLKVVVPNGDTFTVTSQSRSLSTTGATSASVSESCDSSHLATVAITGGSGGETITITPGSGACAEGSTRGGGSGGSSAKKTPPTTPAPAAPSSTVGGQVSALLLQLKTLIAAFEAAGGTVSAEVKNLLNSLDIPAEGVGVGVSSFSRDLDVGTSGYEVTALQNWLIKKGYSIPAGATGFFGGQTKAAVMEYQRKGGLPVTGFFGPKTRAYIQANP